MNLKDKSIALFDFSHAINVAYNAMGPGEAGTAVLQQLSALRSSASHVVVCLDSKPYKRVAVFPEYKAQRKQDPELTNIWARTLQRVRDEGYQCAEAPGEEADDIMATLAREYVAALCTDVRLVTADKDISQCVGAFRRWFVPQLGKRDEFEIRDVPWMMTNWGNVEWAKREKEPKQGPTPDQIPLLLAIMGDASDHIPGVKGIGIVQALALIKTYKTTAAITQAATDAISAAGVEGKKPAALWENWIKGMIDVPKWLALTTLDEHVTLPRPALSYLEHIEPKPLVEESAFPATELDDDIERDAIQGELVDMGEIGGEPTAEELEEERRAMAASLPVDRNLYTPELSDARSVIVGEPPRDPAERRAAMAAEADKVFPLPKGAPAVSQQTAPAFPAVTGAAHDPSKMVIGKDPTADATLRKLAEMNTTPASRERGAKPTEAEIAVTAERISKNNEAERERAAAADSQIVPQKRGPQKPEALAVAAPRWELAVQPKTVEGQMWMAERLHNARVFSAFGNVEGTFGIIAFGRELGMGVMQSLMSFVPVKDKPFMWAHAMRGRVLASPVCEYLINTECTAEASTWIARRVGWPAGVQSTYRFTYAEAVAIGLTTGSNRDNWQKNPRSMVDKTASSRLIRQVFADVLLGIHCPEEAD